MNADYIAGLEEAYRLLNLDEELDYGPGRILERIEQMKGETMKTKTIIERMDEAQRIKETDFQLMALEKMTKERDDLRAKLQRAESALAEREDQLRRAEAQCAYMIEVIELAGSHDHSDGSEEGCVLCNAVNSVLDKPNCGKSLLARLEEARWLLGEGINKHGAVGPDWEKRRDSWLSGHTPTGQSDHALLETARDLLSRCPGIRTDETLEYWDEVQAFLGRWK